MTPFDDAELERRVLAGLPAELELFGGASEPATVIRRPDLIASVSPSTPDRSLFNSVFAEDPSALADSLEELEATYERVGVRAWLVWLPGGHPLGPELLEPRGHVLDGSPRSMAVELGAFVPPARELPDGVTLVGGDIREVGAINDQAYGLGQGAWSTAMTRPPAIPVHCAVAVWDGEPVACAGAIDVDDDICVTAVATLPERQGNGLAGHLIDALISEAGARGARTASLQASKAGAPVYERLGFRDVGCMDLWEKRTA